MTKLILTIDLLHNWENYRLQGCLGLAEQLPIHIKEAIQKACQKHHKEGIAPRRLAKQLATKYPEHLGFIGF